MKSFTVDTTNVAATRLSDLPASVPAVVDSYDATDHRGRRRPPLTRTMAEDHHLDERRRVIMSATSRDLARNFAVASWAIRKHIAFIADFTFQAKTPDQKFNDDFEAWQKEISKRSRFEASGRHSLRRGIRLAEACKTIDGDLSWLKLGPPAGDPNRGRIQAIEGDRVAMPRGEIPKTDDPKTWINGHQIDLATGRTINVAICDRVGKSGKKLARIVPARNLITLAGYEFRYDQIRGISPIAAALNAFRDCAESTEYAMAKLKVGQLFGLQIQTEGASESSALPDPDFEEDADGDGVAESAPRVNLNRGPYVLELEPGEKADILESKTPSSETVAFLKLIIHVALKALDIPYSLFDEAHTNFFGSRAAIQNYLHSCNDKVLDLQEFLDEHLRWRVGLAIEDGELQLPSGKEFDWLTWEYVPGGVPWFNPQQEVKGAAMAVASGFSSPQRICREIGSNFEQNVREIAAAQKFASEQGVDLVYAESSAFAPELTIDGGNADHAK